MDVGGGVGTQTLVIAQAAPHVKCIVQDRDAVIPDAVEVRLYSLHSPSLLILRSQYFNGNAPDLIKSGQVVLQGWFTRRCHITPMFTISLQAHDFFTPQPVKNARVYCVRMILHDWPDSTCIQILKHIRAAAGPDTELIIIESLMEYACDDTTVDENVPGMKSRVASEPLLPNSGHANIFPYLCDLQVS